VIARTNDGSSTRHGNNLWVGGRRSGQAHAKLTAKHFLLSRREVRLLFETSPPGRPGLSSALRTTETVVVVVAASATWYGQSRRVQSQDRRPRRLHHRRRCRRLFRGTTATCWVQGVGEQERNFGRSSPLITADHILRGKLQKPVHPGRRSSNSRCACTKQRRDGSMPRADKWKRHL